MKSYNFVFNIRYEKMDKNNILNIQKLFAKYAEDKYEISFCIKSNIEVKKINENL